MMMSVEASFLGTAHVSGYIDKRLRKFKEIENHYIQEIMLV